MVQYGPPPTNILSKSDDANILSKGKYLDLQQENQTMDTCLQLWTHAYGHMPTWSLDLQQDGII